ncbi:MAG: glycoside hydrolase family 26 protein [Armatimonadota bacterium]|nr:glycoside hydrolase family 26 protein [Armatimonadota bacterium]
MLRFNRLFSLGFVHTLALCGVVVGTAHAGILAPQAPSRLASSSLAKFEPAQGCYIGAFIERDGTLKGDVEMFEEITRKKHASYFTYVRYDPEPGADYSPFPTEWVEKVKAHGAAPHIAFEPNKGLHLVQDDEYLRAWAREAARTKCPIFLRFASEMNGPWTKYSGDPAFYREKFRLVAKVMKEEAPNVAMVWTPFAEPKHLIDQYYPGDEWVDWVGINIYSVYVHNGDPRHVAHEEDPVVFLRYIYDRYAARKPIHISEFAATVECKGTGKWTVDFAIGKMTRFYTALRREFPRVKSVNWFCLDAIRAGLANNNYSIIEDERVLGTYIKLVSDKHFLSQVSDPETGFGIETRLAAITPEKPPAPQKPSIVPAPPAAGDGLRPGQPADDLLISKGAIAAEIQEPWLRGLKNGDVIRDDLHMRVQLPIGLQPSFFIWQVDGRMVALSNAAPWRVTVPRETHRLAPGHHKARVIVVANDQEGTEHSSPEVEFEVAG